MSRGRPSHDHSTPCRARPCRARSKALRPRNLSHVPRPMAPSEPGSTSRVRPRKHRPIFTRPTTRPTANPSGHDRSNRSDHGHDPIIRPIVPTDRPNAAVDPKPVLKPDFICFLDCEN
ncbi:unnamed protein product [Microthlaspi erraticum]|uniref:Uncharacterized protein n=1 Tax=Microthlaspi erraticum TaxID=1685480 RepID=A0A6D2K6E5_9BRAS|nr:unnamed protein product [Microthlaspi erraticum]